MTRRQDESLLRSKLRGLSTKEGVLRANLYDFLEQDLRALWHISDRDTSKIVLAKVIWQMERLISELQREEHRIAARYSYNLTGNEAVERLDMVGRQKALGRRKEHPHPSDRTSRNYMNKVILPRFEASLDERRAPPAPGELLDAVRERAAQGERVPAIMRELLDGTPPPPPMRSGQRRRTLMAAVAGGGLVLILGAALVFWGITRDQPAASDDQNGPTATTTPGTAGPVVTGETVTEVCYNANGCRVFEDPYGSREQPRVEFMQEVEVSCRVYAPSMPSVEWWYRLAGEPYNNEWWSPSATYLNGDPPEGPYERDVDEAVPEC